MRVDLGLLLLLLALCGSEAQGEDGGFREEWTKQTTEKTTPDIWEEVKALRDMVVELKVELRNTELRVKESEKQLNEVRAVLVVTKGHMEQLQRENSVQETRLTDTESKANDLEKANAALTTELTSVKTRLTAAELKTSDLKKENAALQTRLSNSKSEFHVVKSLIDQLDRENAGLGARIDQLERENAEEPKVAFYTGLTDAGNVGPYETDVILKFDKVFTNTGDAYNSATGIFTAPANGVYYFQFTVCGYQTGVMGVSLYKNNQRMIYNGEGKTEVDLEYLTNSVVLELTAGDEIHLLLPSDFSLYDDSSNQSTFSGALLFPL